MEQGSQKNILSNPTDDHEQSARDTPLAMDNANLESRDSPRENSQRILLVDPHDRPPESDPGTVGLFLHAERSTVPPSSPIDVDNLESVDRDFEDDEDEGNGDDNDNDDDEGDDDGDGEGDGDGDGDDIADEGDVGENDIDGSDFADADQIYPDPRFGEADTQVSEKDADDAGNSGVVGDDEEIGEGGEEDDIDMREVVEADGETGDEEAAVAEREIFEDEDIVTDDDANAGGNMSFEGDAGENEVGVEIEEVTVIVETNDFSHNDSLDHEANSPDQADEAAEEDIYLEELGENADGFVDDSDNLDENDGDSNSDSPKSPSVPEDTDMAQVEVVASTKLFPQQVGFGNPDTKDDIISIEDGDNESVEDTDDPGESHDFDESDIERSEPDIANDDGFSEHPENADNTGASDLGAAVETNVHTTIVKDSLLKKEIDGQVLPSSESTQNPNPSTDNAANQFTVASLSPTVEANSQKVPVLFQDFTRHTEGYFQSPAILTSSGNASAENSLPVSETPDSESTMTVVVGTPGNGEGVGGVGREENWQTSNQECETRPPNSAAAQANAPKTAADALSHPSQFESPSTTTGPSNEVASKISDSAPILAIAEQNPNPSEPSTKIDLAMGNSKLQSSRSEIGNIAGLSVDLKENDSVAAILPDTDRAQRGETDKISEAKENTPPATLDTDHGASMNTNLSGSSGFVEMEPKIEEPTSCSPSVVSLTDNADNGKKAQPATSIISADNQHLGQNITLDTKPHLETAVLKADESRENSAAGSTSPAQSVDQKDKEISSGTKMDMDRSNDLKKDQNAAMTAPLFGINPVQESVKEHRPVSFSSPPTFHSINFEPPSESKTSSVLRHSESRAGDGSNAQDVEKQGGSSAPGPVKKHVTFAETIQEFPISPVKNSERTVRLPPMPVSLSQSISGSCGESAISEGTNVEDAPMSPSNEEDGVGTGDGKARNLTPAASKEPLQVITDSQIPGGQRRVEVTNVHISVKHLKSTKRIKCPLSTIRFTFEDGESATIEFIDTDTGTTGTWESLSPSVNYKGVRTVKKPEYALVVVVGSVGVDETKRYYLRCQQRSYETIFRLLHDLTPSHNTPSPLSLTKNNAGNLIKLPNDANDTQTDNSAPGAKVLSSGPSLPASGISGIVNSSSPKNLDSSLKATGLKRQAAQLGDVDDSLKAEKKARVDQSSRSREEKKRASAAILMNKRKELLAQMKTKDTPVSTDGARSDSDHAKGGPRTAVSPSGSRTFAFNEAGSSSSTRRPELTTTSLKNSAVGGAVKSVEKGLVRRDDILRSTGGKRETTKHVGMHPKSGMGSGVSVRGGGGRLGRQSTGSRNLCQSTRVNARISGSPKSLQPRKSIFKAVKMRSPPNNGAEILLESKNAEGEAMLSEDVKKLEKSLEERRKANEGRLLKEVSREVARAVEAEEIRQQAKLKASLQLVLDKALSPWKKQNDLEDKRKTHEAQAVLKARPESTEDFFARLHTFRPSTWPEFDSQSPIGPVECALRGWHNEALGRLASSEGSKIVVDFNELYDSKTRVGKLRSLRSAIEGSGHALLSVWVGEKCPESFRTVEGSKRELTADALRSIAEELRAKNVGDLVTCGRECDHDPWTLPGLHDDKCLKMACSNWRLDGTGFVDLWCNWCNRRFPIIPKCIFTKEADPVSLPPFHPQRSHFNFCPFASLTGPAVHVRALGITVPETTTKDP